MLKGIFGVGMEVPLAKRKGHLKSYFFTSKDIFILIGAYFTRYRAIAILAFEQYLSKNLLAVKGYVDENLMPYKHDSDGGRET